jgi:hypothetical protein
MKFAITDQNGQHIDTIKLEMSISSSGQLQYSVWILNCNKLLYNNMFSPSTTIDMFPGISSALAWAKNYYANPNLKLIFHYP